MDFSIGKSCAFLLCFFLLSSAPGTLSGFAQPTIAEMSLPEPKVQIDAFLAVPNREFIELSWTSSSEIGIIGFQMERQINNINEIFSGVGQVAEWEFLSFIEGKGFPDREASYTFRDSLYEQGGNTITYRLMRVHEDGTTEVLEVIETENASPQVFSARTYTRTGNPIVTIEYKLPEQTRVKIYAYNTSGNYSELLVNKVHESGTFREYFDGSDRTSGLYICKIVAGKETWIEPMLLIK